MMMSRNLSIWFFALLVLGSCQEKKIAPVVNHPAFVDLPSVRLKLPAHFGRGKPQQSRVLDTFLASLPEASSETHFLQDSLSEKHYVTVIPVGVQPYNENLAAIMNSRLSELFYQMQDDCYVITKIESMQYSSDIWKALKFKFVFSPRKGCKQTPFYVTVHYYNGKTTCYFLEFNEVDSDLTDYLQELQFK